MRTVSLSAIGSATLFIILACGGQPAPGQRNERAPGVTDTTSDSVVALDPPGRPVVRPGPPPAASHADSKPIAVRDKKQKDVLSVKELLQDSSLAGRIVILRGTCLRHSAGQAKGSPPLTRSDWELGGGTEAVWVSGPRPANCSVEKGASASNTVKGRVHADTLRMFDGREEMRLYLVLQL